METRWNPTTYLNFADERGRPFVELLTRIQADDPRRVIDVGCGPGTLTALLAQRWPHAQIEGIDSSADMVAAAAGIAGITVRQGTAHDLHLSADCDVLISNAALQWVPGHDELLRRWLDELADDGWIGWQVPANFDMPSHALMRELAETPRWHDRLNGVLRHHDAVGTPEHYQQILAEAGYHSDVWQCTYLHVLTGEDPVLNWVRGTGLRPVLQALSSSDAQQFTAEYRQLLAEAYPQQADGSTVFAFTRTFAVGHRAS